MLTVLDQVEPLYLSLFMISGLVVLTRAMDDVRSADRTAAASLDYLGHCLRRRARLPSGMRFRTRSVSGCRCRWSSPSSR
jgi:hypothetical protein